MRFSTSLIALVFGYSALVAASPHLVEYVTTTVQAGSQDTTPAYNNDAPTTYQVSTDMPEADIYQMLCLVNKCRNAHGKTPLALHPALVKSAQVHSQYMHNINDMTHDDSRGDLGARVTSSGFPSWSKVSENIASGQDSVDQVVQAWINSPGHLANILGGTVYCGFGRVGNMWTQEFASPASQSLYPNGQLEVCPVAGSGSGYSSASEVENTDTYSAPEADTYSTVNYDTQAPVYSTYGNVVYVTETVYGNDAPVADDYQAPDVVYTTVGVPQAVYYTAEPVAATNDGCDD